MEYMKSCITRAVSLGIFEGAPHQYQHISTGNRQPVVYEINTGDLASDELMAGIVNAVNGYILNLARKQILLAFEQSEKEVADLHQRTREGIETARLNGKQIGLPAGTKLVTKKSVEAKRLIRKYSRDFEGSLSDKECIVLIGISRGSYYKYKQELRRIEMEDATKRTK